MPSWVNETGASVTEGKSTRRPRVLIADDEEDIRELLHINLMHEYDVIRATNGRECIEKATSEAPDVILLDIMMPAMDGREVLIELSDRRETRHIPVIFLSALTRPEDRITGLESGAVDYIPKPADPREISARVAAALRKVDPTDGDGSDMKLPDRQAFEHRVAEEAARCLRNGTPLSILVIDVDGPMEGADASGAGEDRIVEQVAATLRTTLRLSDVLFSNGENGFAAILPDTNSATAYLAAERCRTSASNARTARNVTVSIGIAELSGKGTAEDVIAKAELALYRAKDSGGNRSWRADDPRRQGLSARSLSEELTQREWDVLAHLVKRRTEPEIARHLGISAGTVRSHKARIRRKLQVPPNIRLSDFAQANLKDLVEHLNRASN